MHDFDLREIDKKNHRVEIENNRLIIQPQYCLDDMLSRITKENVHHLQFPDDSPKGYEEW